MLSLLLKSLAASFSEGSRLSIVGGDTLTMSGTPFFGFFGFLTLVVDVGLRVGEGERTEDGRTEDGLVVRVVVCWGTMRGGGVVVF
jgi:hypothetical protein